MDRRINEDGTGMIVPKQKPAVTVPLPVECDANIQVTLIQLLEEFDHAADRGSNLSNSVKAFRIHEALVKELKLGY